MTETTIPFSVLEKHLGILGINGSGKTYTAKGCVETLLDKQARVCIIDPTGVWWGLKSSATGKRGAYPIVVFGGEHADLQISGSHGEAIAEAIGTSNTPAIIDTSLMRGGERTKFFTDFVEVLRIKNSGPLHLFIDEAHLFCPQGRVSDPNSAQMLHAANNLISLGRARGLRVTLISQRPAKMHKDSLTQVHSLIAMRLIAPQDRSAVEDWIADQADPVKGKEIIASLPQLKTGEGYLWAPELRILEKMKFPAIKTFDSSKAPDSHGTEKGPVLSPIDLSAIQGRLEAVKTESLANDPSKLKARIRELEKQLVQQKPAELTREITDHHWREGFACGIDAYGAASAEHIANFAQKVFQTLSNSKMEKPKIPQRASKIVEGLKDAVVYAKGDETKGNSTTVKVEHNLNNGLNAPQKRILCAMHFWHSRGQKTPTREMVAGVAGYRPGSGNFTNLVGSLTSMGLLNKPSAGCLGLCQPHGSCYEMDNTEAREMLLSVLDAPHKRIIDALNDGEERTREEVAELSGYAAGSGNFTNLIGKLTTLKIIFKPAVGRLMMADWAREVLT